MLRFMIKAAALLPENKYLSKIILLVIFAFGILLLPSCKSCKKHTEALPVNIPGSDSEFNLEMTKILKDYIPRLPSKVVDSSKYLSWQEVAKEVYKNNQYHPVWVSKNILSDKGKKLFEVVNTAEYYGLNKNLYSVKILNTLRDSLETIAPAVDYELAKELETYLTRAFCEMALHLDHGMFADTIQGVNSNFWSSKKKYVELFAAVSAGSSIDNAFHSLEPQNPIYDRYMKALKDFVSKNNISTEPIYIRDPKSDSAGAVNDARKALVVHHYLADSLQQDDSAFYASLKQFQKDNNLNPDGKIGMMTQKTLERDNSLKFQLLAVNADRWRREDYTVPDRYVWVNLPSCKLRIIERDSVKMEKNVVIGKADKSHPTPTLNSGIDNIILWPSWSVPQSIIKKEMKSFKGYNVTKTGNWTQVIQPPGPNNSLGAVKILFPNKYSVYLHDTPSKYLFKSDYRAQSHGCVRVQDPLEVAAYLMQMDTFKITYDSLLALKQSKVQTKSFKLKKPIPVFFKYFTAEVDWDGKLHYYTDVYKRDIEMMEYIFGRKKPGLPPSPLALKQPSNKDSVAAWQFIPVVEKPAKDSVKILPDSSQKIN